MKLNSKDRKIWFTSDTHYWHKNITFGESVWDNKEKNCRKFDTTPEMSRHMVTQINKYVGEDDILFHLGDWSFGGIENIWNFKKQLKVKEIHLLIGNHDHHIKRNLILPNVRRVEPYSRILEEGKPISGEYPDYVESQTLFTSVNDILDIEIDGIGIQMLHYPMHSWNTRHGKTYHLHGHTHGNIETIEHRLDVGIDSAFNIYGEYKPFSWEEIKTILK